METPTIKRNAGKTTSASVMPSAFEGWMWCIQEGAPGPRSLTKIMSKIVRPRRVSTEATALSHFGFGVLVKGRSSRKCLLSELLSRLKP